MVVRSARSRYAVHLSAHIATQLWLGQQGDDLKRLHTLELLRHKRSEALTAHPDVLIVIVRAIYREIVCPAAYAVDHELAGSSHTRTDARADGVSDGKRCRSDARGQ